MPRGKGPEIRQNSARRASGERLRPTGCPSANREPSSCKHRSSHDSADPSAAAVGVTESSLRAATRLLLSRICRSLGCPQLDRTRCCSRPEADTTLAWPPQTSSNSSRDRPIGMTGGSCIRGRRGIWEPKLRVAESAASRTASATGSAESARRALGEWKVRGEARAEIGCQVRTGFTRVVPGPVGPEAARLRERGSSRRCRLRACRESRTAPGSSLRSCCSAGFRAAARSGGS